MAQINSKKIHKQVQLQNDVVLGDESQIGHKANHSREDNIEQAAQDIETDTINPDATGISENLQNSTEDPFDLLTDKDFKRSS